MSGVGDGGAQRSLAVIQRFNEPDRLHPEMNSKMTL